MIVARRLHQQKQRELTRYNDRPIEDEEERERERETEDADTRHK